MVLVTKAPYLSAQSDNTVYFTALPNLSFLSRVDITKNEFNENMNYKGVIPDILAKALNEMGYNAAEVPFKYYSHAKSAVKTSKLPHLESSIETIDLIAGIHFSTQDMERIEYVYPPLFSDIMVAVFPLDLKGITVDSYDDLNKYAKKLTPVLLHGFDPGDWFYEYDGLKNKFETVKTVDQGIKKVIDGGYFLITTSSLLIDSINRNVHLNFKRHLHITPIKSDGELVIKPLLIGINKASRLSKIINTDSDFKEKLHKLLIEYKSRGTYEEILQENKVECREDGLCK
jgi:hypothetical protein